MEKPTFIQLPTGTIIQVNDIIFIKQEEVIENEKISYIIVFHVKQRPVPLHLLCTSRENWIATFEKLTDVIHEQYGLKKIIPGI